MSERIGMLPSPTLVLLGDRCDASAMALLSRSIIGYGGEKLLYDVANPSKPSIFYSLPPVASVKSFYEKSMLDGFYDQLPNSWALAPNSRSRPLHDIGSIKQFYCLLQGPEIARSFAIQVADAQFGGDVLGFLQSAALKLQLPKDRLTPEAVVTTVDGKMVVLRPASGSDHSLFERLLGVEIRNGRVDIVWRRKDLLVEGCHSPVDLGCSYPLTYKVMMVRESSHATEFEGVVAHECFISNHLVWKEELVYPCIIKARKDLLMIMQQEVYELVQPGYGDDQKWMAAWCIQRAARKYVARKAHAA
ncbi:MAG: hypothetical protein SGARI_004358 [Bacillariaceae sp.]